MRTKGLLNIGISVLFAGICCSAVSAQDLERGHFEIRASGGVNGGNNTWGSAGEPSWSIGGAVGLSRYVALTAGYTHDKLQDAHYSFCNLVAGQPFDPTSCLRYDTNSALHQFMGGVRFSAVNRSRLTPFVRLDLGVAHRTLHSSHPVLADGTDMRTEFSFAPGAGLDVKLTRHFGLSTEAAYVKPRRFGGFYRVMGGVYYRF